MEEKEEELAELNIMELADDADAMTLEEYRQINEEWYQYQKEKYKDEIDKWEYIDAEIEALNY